MRTLIIDSQILSSFQECPEKYNLTHQQHLKPNWPIEALVKGDVLHAGFEGYYKYLMEGLRGDQSRSILHTQGIELAVTEARAKAALNGIDLNLAEEVITVMEEYFYFYQNDDIVPIAVEEPFIFKIYEDAEMDLRVLYAGKIDLVATAGRYQWSPTPFDNKSSGRRDTPSGRSNQFFGYCMALDTSLLVVNKVGFQKSLTPAERFKRHTLSYPEEYRERWKLNTIKTAVRLVRAIETGVYEENLTSCDKYSGCVMKPICESITPEAKEWKIQSQYIIGEPWDVTKVLGLGENGEKLIDARIEEPSSPSLSSSNDCN